MGVALQKWEIEKEGNYVDDKIEGKWVGYYESGKVKREVRWVKGKWVMYWENGHRLEANYVDGKKRTVRRWMMTKKET